MRLWAARVFAGLLLACSLAWAQDGVESGGAPDAAVRVAYLVAEGTRVHVRLGDVTIVSTLEPGSVSGYRLVRSGDHEVTILDASEDAEEGLGPASAPVMGRTEGAFQPGGYYTLVLTDRAGDEGDDERGPAAIERTVDVHVFGDRLDAFAGAGEARIRMLNLLPGGSSWSVHGVPAGEDRARSERSREDEIEIAAAVPYAEAGPWVGIPMGIYFVRFEAESDGDPVPAPLEAALYGGTLYTAFVYPGPHDDAPRVAIRVDAVVRAAPGPAPARPGGPP